MKKLLCKLLSCLIVLSTFVPVSAIVIEKPENIAPQAAVLRSGSSTKRYYIDPGDSGAYNVPIDVTMHWSLTYFVDTGKINSCSTPSMTVSIPTSYEYYNLFEGRLHFVTTNKQKSGDYSCLFNSSYQVGLIYNSGFFEDTIPTESMIVRAYGEGEASVQ